MPKTKRKDLPTSPTLNRPTTASGGRGRVRAPTGYPSSPSSGRAAHAVMKSAQVTLQAAHKVLDRSGAPAGVLQPLAGAIKALKSHLGRRK